MTITKILGTGAMTLAALSLGGCTRDWKSAPVSMWNESRYKPYEATSFFADQNTSRPTVQGTVARGQLRTDEEFFNGTKNGVLVTTMPFPVTKAVLQRGQERFNIYCTPCHGDQGAGNGMIVQRGFSKPPDYTETRLINAPIGHFYDVMTNGYGSMYSYASRVSPRDRWAIAAYIRVLQRSRTATINDVAADQRGTLPDNLAPGTTTGGTPASGPNGMSHRPDDEMASSSTANNATVSATSGTATVAGQTSSSQVAAPQTTTKPTLPRNATSPSMPVVPGTGTKSGGQNNAQFGPNNRRENGGTTTTPSGAPATAGYGAHD